jgi:hypothetical protein
VGPALISVVVPTCGRPTLRDTVLSVPADDDLEVIVVADGPEAHRLALQALEGVRRPVTVCFTDATPGMVGHPQRMRGMEIARGAWLSFMDDDDTYTDDAFTHLRAVTGFRGPYLFQMRYAQTGEVLWAHKSLCRGNVGTPMFFCRNQRLGVWKPERTGDFDFIESTCAKQGLPIWHDEIVCHVRPAAS